MLIMSLGCLITDHGFIDCLKKLNIGGKNTVLLVLCLEKVTFDQLKNLYPTCLKAEGRVTAKGFIVDAFTELASMSVNNSINGAYFRKVMSSCGEKLTEEEMKELFQDSLLINKDGNCALEPFIKYLSGVAF